MLQTPYNYYYPGPSNSQGAVMQLILRTAKCDFFFSSLSFPIGPLSSFNIWVMERWSREQKSSCLLQISIIEREKKSLQLLQLQKYLALIAAF